MEMNRLNESQISQLQNHEQVKCLMPHEIQNLFGLLSLKEEYNIPEKDAEQSGHNQRLRAELKRANVAPMVGDISPLEVEAIHVFDWNVKKAIEEGFIKLHYMGGSTKKKISDEF